MTDFFSKYLKKWSPCILNNSSVLPTLQQNITTMTKKRRKIRYAIGQSQCQKLTIVYYWSL